MTVAKAKKPAIPKGLGAAGKSFWQKVTDSYELRPDEVRLLSGACRTLDLIGQIEDALAGQPLLVAGQGGQLKTHPLVVEVRHQRLALAAALKQLRLPDEPGEARSAEAAGARSSKARAAANARWAKRGSSGVGRA